MDNWNENIVPPQEDAELKSIRKSLQRQNLKNVLTSLILAAALLLVSVYGIIPAVEKLYWGPYDSDYDAGSDLHLVLKANTELFHPGYKVQMLAGKSGFASYDLHITRTDDATGQKEYLNGTLSRGDLSLDYAYYDRGMEELYFHADYVQDLGNGEIYDIRDMWTEDAVELISQLPNYIQLKAIAFFPEDLNMEQLVQFYQNTEDLPLRITWVGIRNCPMEENLDLTLDGPVSSERTGPIRLCGMNPFSGGTYFFASEDNHSYFPSHLEYLSQEELEQYFKSLLQYSSNQCSKGEGIPVWEGKDYYQTVLDYVEEHGVMCYGAVVVASPQTLLELLDQDIISYVTLLDAWIDLE